MARRWKIKTEKKNGWYVQIASLYNYLLTYVLQKNLEPMFPLWWLTPSACIFWNVQYSLSLLQQIAILQATHLLHNFSGEDFLLEKPQLQDGSAIKLKSANRRVILKFLYNLVRGGRFNLHNETQCREKILACSSLFSRNVCHFKRYYCDEKECEIRVSSLNSDAFSSILVSLSLSLF